MEITIKKSVKIKPKRLSTPITHKNLNTYVLLVPEISQFEVCFGSAWGASGFEEDGHGRAGIQRGVGKYEKKEALRNLLARRV